MTHNGQIGNQINDQIFQELSVIIPFTANDVLWKDLLQDLIPLPKEAEIILVGPDAPDSEMFKKATAKIIAQIRYVYSPIGRGLQLNTGAKKATKNYFWFLHADSKIPRPSLHMLERELAIKKDALHYFDLQFLNDGPKLMGLNSLAANFRSRIFGIPFGDQGFAVSRAVFYRIGGFSERTNYGEDHNFVWEAKKKRVPLNHISGAIFTSARQYQTTGWSKLTGKRIYLTTKRATKECVKLVKKRIIESWL
ncbi:MAG: hypothetical protein A2Z20_09485 [Bdellovibrionales bacterium RBG_16_40_8]|nr:MAG: hypothetical protein A2Z20_09485 [Bdellovibrionales bacterium RBG_16_40_8]